MLLSRVADNVYWGARYLERAEDTARIVRAYTELIVDLPVTVASSWEPLLAIAGSRAMFDIAHPRVDEAAIVAFLAAERANPGSVASSIDQARENLRTTREVLPREAWQAVNDLYLFSHANANGAVERRSRARFLSRVIQDSQQIEGVIATAMSRDAAFHLWTLGRVLERADMTTRVVGVRAAGLLAAARAGTTDEVHDDVQATRDALERLPHRDRTLPSVDRLEALLAAVPDAGDDGAALDAATDALQVGLATVSDAVSTAFLRSVR